MQPCWTVHNTGDVIAQARQTRTATDYQFWRVCQPVEEIAGTADWTTVVATLTRSTGMSRSFLTRNLDALYTLDQLPQLRALVEATWVLDMHQLAIIDRAAARAPQGLKGDPFFWATLDADLVARMTPSRAHQLLPTDKALREVVQSTIRTLQTPDDTQPGPADPDQGPADEDPAPFMRSLPAAEDPSPAWLWIDTLDNGNMRFELTVDQTTGTFLNDAITQTARDVDASPAQAMVSMLLEGVETTVTCHLYTARDVPGAPVYHPTQGILTEKAAQDLLGMVDSDLDMDAAAHAVTPSYRPTPAIRAFLIGRDWICRWPGCTSTATTGDNDHRINHADGGPTTAANMVMLCRHHHNRKTDVQATYLLDPVTGDVYWHFADGTWAVSQAIGPLAPVEKRWVQTYAQRRGRRDEAAANRALAEEFEAYQARTAPAEKEDADPPADNDPDPPPF